MARHMAPAPKGNGARASQQRGYAGQQARTRSQAGYQQQYQYAQAPRTHRAASGASRQTAGYGHAAGYGSYAGGNGMYNGHTVRPKRRRRWPVVLGVVFAVLLVLGVAGGLAAKSLYDDVKTVQADAQQVMGVADTLKEAVSSGDSSSLATAMENTAEAASRMNVTTHGALWNLACYVPVYGEDVKTVQTITQTFDSLASDALVPLGKSMSGISLSNLIGEDNTINVEALQDVVDALEKSAPQIHEATQTINDLPEAHIEKLGELMGKAQDKLTTVDNAVQLAEGIAPYIPQLFGANGETCTYLITAQNTAEIRATGGFPGSMGAITVTNGRIEVGDFSSMYKVLAGIDYIDLGLTDEEIAAYDWSDISHTDNIGDASMSPDFTRAAQIWAQAYEYTHPGTTVTAVFGVNPVFLQNMMALTGQTVEVDGLEVNGSNVGTALMRDAYWNLSTDAQDVFFSDVASQVFSGMMGSLSQVGIKNLMEFVVANVDAGNLRICFSQEEMGRALEDLHADGAIPDSDPAKPVVGVYFNDYTYSKMGWYVSINSTVGEGVKNADGTTTYQVTSTIKNNLTPAEEAILPDYVKGYNIAKRTDGDMVFALYLTMPGGGTITNVSASSDQGGSMGFTEYAVGEHHMLRGVGHLNAQEAMDVTYTVTVSASATEPLTTFNNPTAQTVANW